VKLIDGEIVYSKSQEKFKPRGCVGIKDMHLRSDLRLDGKEFIYLT